jgi:hypothetical protein
MNTMILPEMIDGSSLHPVVLPIAVLCVHKNNHYRGMEGVEVYDKKRDARTFPGGMAVVAHPPCRAWSAFCRHQAKPEPGEKELGLWCANQVDINGGILEQPAHSTLWMAAGLPMPGRIENPESWSAEVWQVWWGFFQAKRTWLYFSKIHPSHVHWPLRLHPRGGDKRAWQLSNPTARSKSTPEFARWMVETARHAGPND